MEVAHKEPILEGDCPAWLSADEAAFEASHPIGKAPRAGVLNRVLVRALRSHLAAVPPSEHLDRKPLTLLLSLPLPTRLRFYVYKATQHASERQADTFRIQLTSGGDFEEIGGRYRFKRTDNVRPVLVGYEPALRLFLIWDADVHDAGEGFPHSKGVQAPPELVYGAMASGLEDVTRHVRSVGLLEHIVAARPENLARALLKRIELSNQSLFADARC